MSQGAGLRRQVVRFVAVGGLNTVVTYGIFVGLGLVISPGIAYTIAFAVGLVWVVFGSSRFVFGGGHGVGRILGFAGWYLLVYGAGRLVVNLIDPQGFVQLVVTSGAILAVTTPLSFIGGRLIFRATDRARDEKVKQ